MTDGNTQPEHVATSTATHPASNSDGNNGPNLTAVESSSPQRRRWPDFLLGFAYVAAAIGLPIHWLAVEPAMGASLQYLPTYGAVVLLYLLTLVWVALFSPFGRGTRLNLLVGLVLPVAVVAGCIRKIEFSGDMRLVVTWRWEKTYAERIAAHQKTVSKDATTPTTEVKTNSTSTSVSANEFRPEEMPAYRGVHRDGVVIGPVISADDWSNTPPKLLWQRPCGGGYSQFVVVGSKLITQEQQDQEEAIACYDATNGQELWTHRYRAFFSEAMGGDGPRATPLIHGDRVYSVGAQGDLFALTLNKGEVIWHVNILESLHIPNAMWGISSSPLIVDGLVIVNPGGPRGNGVVAYRISDGSLAWKTAGIDDHATFGKPENRPGYSAPFLATISGVEQLLLFDGTGLRSYRPESGKLLWETEFENGAAVSVAQPIVFDDGRILLSASYDIGSTLRKVTLESGQWKVETLWGTKEKPNLNLRSKFSSPVLHEGLVYGMDEGIMVCLDPDTGERLWKKGRYGHGQLLITNGRILVGTEDGRIVLIAPSREGLKELGSFQALPGLKNWNPPALADGILYVRNHLEAAAYDLNRK